MPSLPSYSVRTVNYTHVAFAFRFDSISCFCFCCFDSVDSIDPVRTDGVQILRTYGGYKQLLLKEKKVRNPELFSKTEKLITKCSFLCVLVFWRNDGKNEKKKNIWYHFPALQAACSPSPHAHAHSFIHTSTYMHKYIKLKYGVMCCSNCYRFSLLMMVV